MNPVTQIILNARVDSVKDEYMDAGAVTKLKYDLLNDTGAHRVEVAISRDGLLTASVWMGTEEHTAEVKLSRVVPTPENITEADIKKVIAEDEKKRGDANAKRAKDEPVHRESK